MPSTKNITSVEALKIANQSTEQEQLKTTAAQQSGNGIEEERNDRTTLNPTTVEPGKQVCHCVVRHNINGQIGAYPSYSKLHQ